MKKILVFGNPLVREDSLPLQLLPLLHKEFPSIEFKEFDSAEELERESPVVWIIDSVKGIKKVELIEDLERIELQPRTPFSLHDFDLAHSLKLLKKLGLLKEAKIFGVPVSYPKKKAFAELKKLIHAQT
jgi:Ni,Fe-hydrogenase maturation factor